MARLTIPVAALVAALMAGAVLCGCASSSHAKTETTALHSAVEDYSAAYLSGEGGAAWNLLSSRCKGRISKSEMRTMTTLAAKKYGAQPIMTLTIDSISGGMARVTYTYSQAAINQVKEPWVREGDQWREDDC